MLKLDNNLLDELGLGGLPEDQKQAMLRHIYDTLELRVGTNLANQMTDRQLQEFEQFIDDSGEANQAQALQWLESNLPNYKQVVNEVFEALKAEIKQMAPQIMASSGISQQPVAPTPALFQPPTATQPMSPGMQLQPVPASAGPYQYQPPISPTAPPVSMQSQQAFQAPLASVPGYQVPVAAPSSSLQPQPQPVVMEPMAPVSQPGMVSQQPVQLQQDAQLYQFPLQQPPAGPGGYQQPPPQYPGGQQAA